MAASLSNAGSSVQSDTRFGDSQAADHSAPTTPPQRATDETPSGASPHRQNLGHRRRATTAIGGHFTIPPRRLPVINSRHEVQRPGNRTPDRAVRQHRRIRTVRTHRRSESFLQYLSSVQNLSREIAGVQQTGLPEQGNRLLLANRSWRDPPTPMLQPNIAGLGQNVIGLSICTRRFRPCHLPASRVTAPTSTPMPEPSRLSMHSLGNTDNPIAEHDTQLSVRLNAFRWPGHPMLCECQICVEYNRSP
ncbi:Uncharacterized protein HZ326_2306 [Fusarium oxysporum f. sp. albedinis]|nr:Uncharacterized protein HZ326_2306 [Fusarium oxysporum f. sp. albedinis]